MISQSISKEISFSEESIGNLVPQDHKKLLFDHFQDLGLVNEEGKLRLKLAIDYFEKNRNYFPLLPELFEAWRDESEYMIYQHIVDGEIEMCEDGFTPKHYAFKCSKRGNDIYVERIKARFRRLLESANDTRLFSLKDFTPNHIVKTKLLWITLEYNPYKYSITEAWKNVGYDFNRFVSALRKKYGDLSYLRSWETHDSGYPHIHVCMIFKDAEFSVFQHFSMKEGSFQYRIQERDEIKSYWQDGKSWVDIRALSSSRSVVNYIVKYQLKVNESKEGESKDPSIQERSKTLAFMWLFRKRSYSVSGDFFESLSTRHDSELHNSNMEFDPFVPVESWILKRAGVLGREIGLLNGQWMGIIDLEYPVIVDILFAGNRMDYVNSNDPNPYLMEGDHES